MRPVQELRYKRQSRFCKEDCGSQFRGKVVQLMQASLPSPQLAGIPNMSPRTGPPWHLHQENARVLAVTSATPKLQCFAALALAPCPFDCLSLSSLAVAVLKTKAILFAYS